MALIDDVRDIYIRMKSTALDTEVIDLIDAAKERLRLAGIVNVDENDPLIKQAITSYAKAYFGWNNSSAGFFANSYDLILLTLTSSTKYSFCTITFSVTDGTNPIDGATVTFGDEELTTGAAGTATFYVYENNNIEYTVSADGYDEVESEIDVTASATVNVVLTEV